jgi:hypothetical protein
MDSEPFTGVGGGVRRYLLGDVDSQMSLSLATQSVRTGSETLRNMAAAASGARPNGMRMKRWIRAEQCLGYAGNSVINDLINLRRR